MGKNKYCLYVVSVHETPDWLHSLNHSRIKELIEDRWPIVLSLRKFVRKSDEKPFKTVLERPAALTVCVEAIDQSKLKNTRFSSIVYLEAKVLSAPSKVRVKEGFPPNILDDIHDRDRLGIILDYHTGVGVICSQSGWMDHEQNATLVQHGLPISGRRYSRSILRHLKVPKEVRENQGIIMNLGHICSGEEE